MVRACVVAALQKHTQQKVKVIRFLFHFFSFSLIFIYLFIYWPIPPAAKSLLYVVHTL